MENATSFLRKSSSPFFLQELRPLTPLKTIDKFTSLMIIGMMKLMCNKATWLLLELISTDLWFHVVACKTPNEIWTTLEGLFGK
jgi:hypothetical protein